MLWAAGRLLGSPDLGWSGPARDLRLAPDRASSARNAFPGCCAARRTSRRDALL